MKIIRHLKGFKKTSGGSGEIMHCADESGVDWYEIADNAPADEKALHIMVDAEGLVRSVSDNIQRLWPAGFDVISVEAPASIKMLDLIEIEDGRVKVLPENPIIFAQEKARALDKVEARIKQLERVKRLGMAEEQELKELDQLEVYSVRLMRAKDRDCLTASK